LSTRSKRADVGAAVAGLFDRPTATGGLAGPRSESVQAATTARAARVDASEGEPRMRLGVELSERELAYLRGLSRPARTGGPRTLGSKFVGTGVLVAAIELLRTVDVEMDGVVAGDLEEMTARARAALVRAAQRETEGEPQ
jgi:hypothetical protein